MPFEAARWLEAHHILVYKPDMILDPPQSYLFVQDFLILLCALLYCFCYIFFSIRIIKERFIPAPISLMYARTFAPFLQMLTI